MKLKQFDKMQHYSLDKIVEKAEQGKDLAFILSEYFNYWTGLYTPDEMVEKLHRQLRDYPAKDPDHGQWRTWGFVVPFHGQEADICISNPLKLDVDMEQALAIEVHETGALVICVEKREKVLPSSAINDKLYDRAREFAEREQREPTRKDYAILKDEITAQLLKTAPVRRSRIYVMFDHFELYVFTSSQKAAEETCALIRTAFSSLPTVPVYNSEEALMRFFKKILLKEDDVYETFIPGASIKLRNDEKEVITVKDGDLDDRRYTDLLKQGFVPVELEFCYRHNQPGLQNIWVKMNHKGDIKAFSTSEDDGEAEFEDQYEKGGDGLQSKMAELWVLHKAITAFVDAMAQTGTMIDRDEINEYQDGDELHPLEEPDEEVDTAAPDTEVDDDDAWEDEGDEDDGDI